MTGQRDGTMEIPLANHDVSGTGSGARVRCPRHIISGLKLLTRHSLSSLEVESVTRNGQKDLRCRLLGNSHCREPSRRNSHSCRHSWGVGAIYEFGIGCCKYSGHSKIEQMDMEVY